MSRQAILDSLIQAEIDSLRNIEELDTLKLEQNRQDSLLKAKQDSIKIAKHSADSIRSLIQQNDNDLITNPTIENAPIAAPYTTPGYKNVLNEEISDLSKKAIYHEAGTNVLEDVSKYHSVQQTLLDLHLEYQQTTELKDPALANDIRPGMRDLHNILESESIVKLSGANGLDQIWYTMEAPLTKFNRNYEEFYSLEVKNMDEILGENDFRHTTVARLVASDPDIRKAVYGYTDVDEESNESTEHQGFIDVLGAYGLNQESEVWKTMKGWLGVRSNELRILDAAVRAKGDGKYYFIDDMGKKYKKDHPIYSGLMTRLESMPLPQAHLVKETLQNFVNDIYTKGEKVEEQALVLLDEYYTLKTRFPKKEGPITREESMYHNSDLQTSKDLNKDLYSLIDTYEYFTSEQYNLQDSLNTLAIQTLETELGKLPDMERTEALDKWLIMFANELQEVPGAK